MQWAGQPVAKRRYHSRVTRPVERPSPRFVEDVASTLGLEVLRSLAGGLFGAVLVDGPSGPLVLKALPSEHLGSTWATGAAVAESMRTRGYPAPRYEWTGTLPGAVWSLQEHLAGDVPERLTASGARQLVALITMHETDSGLRRQWRDEAVTAAHTWLSDLRALDVSPGAVDVLAAALDRTCRTELLDATVVHGDFHHRNCLVDPDGEVVGVFDWEIASAGDWRFDLATLLFACVVYPKSCDRDAVAVVTNAFTERCPRDVRTLMMACQALRILAQEAAYRPDRLRSSLERIVAATRPWLDSGG